MKVAAELVNIRRLDAGDAKPGLKVWIPWAGKFYKGIIRARHCFLDVDSELMEDIPEIKEKGGRIRKFESQLYFRE